MTPDEWESLCDGCGKCCLHKLEDEDTGEIYFTRVACYLLDEHSCRCRQYEQRQQLVPDCLSLTPDQIGQLSWLPSTCAYRLVGEGKDLLPWHPLVSGDPNSVHRALMSVRGLIVNEQDVADDEYEEHIVHWIN